VRTGARATSTVLRPMQCAKPCCGRPQPSRAPRSRNAAAPKAAPTASATGCAGRATRRQRHGSDVSDDDESDCSDDEVEGEVGSDATKYKGAFLAYPAGHKLASAAPEFLAPELRFCGRAADGSFLVSVTYRYEHRDEVLRFVAAPFVCNVLLQRREVRPRDRCGGRNGE
jgi:hypothetical protein